MVFNSASLTQLRVAARLGMYSGETTGRAWFDQLRLEKVQPTPTPPPECQVVDQPTCTPVIRPDLVVTNVTAPATGVIGGFVNVGVQIFNQGEGNADPAQIDFYYSTDNVITGNDRHSGYFCTRESIGGLNSGGTGGCAGGIGVPADLAPGFYYVGAIVDGDEKVSETDETNNSRAAVGPILLSAPEAPAAFDRARSLAPADPTTGTGAVQGMANAARRAPIAYGSGQPMAAPNSP
jgi:hypothetical protein